MHKRRKIHYCVKGLFDLCSGIGTETRKRESTFLYVQLESLGDLWDLRPLLGLERSKEVGSQIVLFCHSESSSGCGSCCLHTAVLNTKYS